MKEIRRETDAIITGTPVESLKSDSQRTPPGIRFDDLKKDFRLLSDLIYLDSASTSISPEPVLSAMLEYEHNYRANVGRGVHRLAQIASQRYWHAHEKVARFVGAGDGLASERQYTFHTLPTGVLRGIGETIAKRDLSGVARSTAILTGLAVTTAGYVRGRIIARSHSYQSQPEFVPLPVRSQPK